MARRKKSSICEECGDYYISTGGGIRWCRNCGTRRFVRRAKLVHGEKYDYSRSVYNTANDEVEIICPEHGLFMQTPSSHISGHGCHDCGGTKKLTKETFIKKAIKVHGTKYGYEQVNYVNSKTKVRIRCKIHGYFEQIPNSHLSGLDCLACGGSKKLTKSEFISKAVKTHGSRYDYSEVEYINNVTKIKIICKIHGSFHQRPEKHLSGNGCPVCGRKNFTTEMFIQKALNVHGNRYGYDEAVFVSSRDPVKIRCKVHGIFEQTPQRHLSGRGCQECGTKRLTTEIFVQRARKIHGEKYDYEKVRYVSRRKKVKIICEKHGVFEQSPGAHLRGQGCPKCAYDRQRKIPL